MNTGFDIIDATVDSYLGIKKNICFTHPSSYYAVNIIYANAGVFEKIEGYQSLLDSDVIENMFFYKTKGMVVGSDKASSSRVGSFIVKAKDKSELLKKTKTAIENIEVYDINNNSLMRKDIYLKNL